MIAHFEGCLAAFDAAGARDPAPPDQLRWRAELRAGVSECVLVHRERDTVRREPPFRTVLPADER